VYRLLASFPFVNADCERVPSNGCAKVGRIEPVMNLCDKKANLILIVHGLEERILENIRAVALILCVCPLSGHPNIRVPLNLLFESIDSTW
jgi:hypothetical protein